MKKFKKNENRINKDDFFIHMFIWTWIYIVILSVFIFVSINVEAASDNTTGYTDLYYPMEQDENQLFNNAVKDYFESDSDISNGYYLSWWWRDISTVKQYYVVVYSSEQDGQAQGFSGTGSHFNMGYNPVGFYAVSYDIYQHTVTKYSENYVSGNKLSSLPSSKYSQNASYISNYVVTTANINETVLNYSAPPFNYTGHSVAPSGLPDYFPNVSLQHTPTSPTFSSYTFTTYNSPTIDTSSVSSLLESLIDIVVYNFDYLLSNLLGILQNLFNNISALFSFLIDWIQYAVKALISNIVNFMSNIYDNIVSLFEPFFDMMHDLYLKFLVFVLKAQEFIDLFINPFDYDEFEEDLDNWEFKNRTDDLAHSFSDFVAIFSSAHEPQTYTFYIGWLQEMPDHSFREINLDQNLDWLNDLKPKYKPVLWVVTIVELFQFTTSHVSHFISGRFK